MKMNITLLKQVSLLSVMIGMVVGLVSIIPVVGSLVFVLYFMLFSASLIIYLKKNNILGEISIKEGAIFGAITGITSMIGLYCSYVPIALIISLLNNNYINPVATLVKYGFTSPLYLFTLLFLLLLAALLCGLMNSFGGGVTVYIYEVLANMQKEDNEKFTLR